MRQMSDCAKSLQDGTTKDKDDALPLRLTSSVSLSSENEKHVLNDESADVKTVTSLSIKAANVAVQWLELLNQDARGRLTALKRSRKRICAVLYTELPLLMSREFSSTPQNDTIDNTSCRDKANADAHFVKWTSIFKQMDEALHEEEVSLEKMLNQLKQLESHCKNGIMGITRFEETSGLGHDMAVKAAAASMYSTCNYLLSEENLHQKS